MLTVILLLGLFPAMAREYVVSGPEGGLAMKVALPEGFNPKWTGAPSPPWSKSMAKTT